METVQKSAATLKPHNGDVGALARSLDDRWRVLCAQWLAVTPADSKWRYSRASEHNDPEQGWKLHLSANLLTACDVLERIAPFLGRRGVLFKGPVSLEEVRRINSGLFYGYSQVGKVFTVYTRNADDALCLARRLHKMTLGLPGPSVPFDLKFREDSSVHYRYGAFAPLEIENSDGTRTPAIRDPVGALVPDSREVATPAWISTTLSKAPPNRTRSSANPLKTTFRAFRALSRRGKGGVYLALDVSVNPPRLCVLKEGRRGGEIEWDGRDGRWRVQNEERVLRDLRGSGLTAPQVYGSFEVEGNYYVAMELIQGESFQAMLQRRQTRLSLSETLRYAIQIAAIVSKIHAAGWVWRDCKPANLIVSKGRELKPVDFEGACPIECDEAAAWSTWEFAPPEWQHNYLANSNQPGDAYALGSVVYFLLTGRVPEKPDLLPVARLRRGVPSSVSAIVSDLLSPDPVCRPDAHTAGRRFADELACLEYNGGN